MITTNCQKCGREFQIYPYMLRVGRGKFCSDSCKSTRHGHTRNFKNTKTYMSWRAMMNRCFRVKDVNYHRYGGRGITVCQRWLLFENFLTDMRERPDGKTLDRFPNKYGNYEPGNCRWATPQQQADNRIPWREYNFAGHVDHHRTRN